MINLLIFPALFFAIRQFMSTGVSGLIAEQVLYQRNAVARVVNEIFISTIFNVIMNITVFLVTIYGLRDHLQEKQRVLVISTVYAVSVLQVGFKLIFNAYWIYDLSKYLLRHGVHGPRAWLRSHVVREVNTHFQQMGWLKRLAYKLSGAPREKDLIEILTREIWKVVMTKALATVAIILVYVSVFSLYTRPILIQEATRLNWLQAFLWPFGFSIDYFLHTHIANWIEHALRF